MGRVVASAYCGTLLGDMGAEIIKIERPGGEFDRELGPFAPNGRAIVYDLIYHRNKKSITLNYVTPEGKSILNELIGCFKSAEINIIVSSETAEEKYGISISDIVIKVESDQLSNIEWSESWMQSINHNQSNLLHKGFNLLKTRDLLRKTGGSLQIIREQGYLKGFEFHLPVTY